MLIVLLGIWMIVTILFGLVVFFTYDIMYLRGFITPIDFLKLLLLLLEISYLWKRYKEFRVTKDVLWSILETLVVLLRIFPEYYSGITYIPFLIVYWVVVIDHITKLSLQLYDLVNKFNEMVNNGPLKLDIYFVLLCLLFFGSWWFDYYK